MSQKFKIDNQEYDVSDLTEKGKSTLISLQFTTQRLAELKNMLGRSGVMGFSA